MEHPWCDLIYLTDVMAEYECDVFFPEFDRQQFKLQDRYVLPELLRCQPSDVACSQEHKRYGNASACSEAQRGFTPANLQLCQLKRKKCIKSPVSADHLL